MRKFLMFAITALLTVIVWNLPAHFFGIEGLTVVQQRVIAIFVMAILLWITEAIPAWATSITIIFVMLFCERFVVQLFPRHGRPVWQNA